MTDSPLPGSPTASARGTPRPHLLTAALLVAAAGAVTWRLWSLETRVDLLLAEVSDAREQGRTLVAEVTRMRIEQKMGTPGPKALIERLRTYVPAWSDARTSSIGRTDAERELEDVLRSFEGLEGGLAEIQTRLAQLKPEQDHDEMRWLLRCALRADPKAGADLVASVLQGKTHPHPRLRWSAASLLIDNDLPRARIELRRILQTESWRGVDTSRGTDLVALDQNAIANNGFFHFVDYYLSTEDPQTEATLLQVLARNGQDTPTLQSAIKWLGDHRSSKALQQIEQLYRKPPNNVANPLFLNKCLDAIVAIQGREALPFLDAELAHTESGPEVVHGHVQYLIEQMK